MVVLLRYAFLLSLGAVSFVTLIGATAIGGQMVLAEVGRPVDDTHAMTFWVLAGLASLSLLSMFRFVLSGIPSLVRSWFDFNKDRLFTLVLGGIVCAVFLLT